MFVLLSLLWCQSVSIWWDKGIFSSDVGLQYSSFWLKDLLLLGKLHSCGVLLGQQAVNWLACAVGCQHLLQLTAGLRASSVSSSCVPVAWQGWLLSAYVPLAQPPGETFSCSWGRRNCLLLLLSALTHHPLGRTLSSPSPVLWTGAQRVAWYIPVPRYWSIGAITCSLLSVCPGKVLVRQTQIIGLCYLQTVCCLKQRKDVPLVPDVVCPGQGQQSVWLLQYFAVKQ